MLRFLVIFVLLSAAIPVHAMDLNELIGSRWTITPVSSLATVQDGTGQPVAGVQLSLLRRDLFGTGPTAAASLTAAVGGDQVGGNAGFAGKDMARLLPGLLPQSTARGVVQATGSLRTDAYQLTGRAFYGEGAGNGATSALGIGMQGRGVMEKYGMIYQYRQQIGADNDNDGRTLLPLYILPENSFELVKGFGATNGRPDQHAVGLYADIAVNGSLDLHWALGYSAMTHDKEMMRVNAWEYNMGVAYKVLKNLIYEAHFGYLTAKGEALEDRSALESAPLPTIDDVYMVTNNITMTF